MAIDYDTSVLPLYAADLDSRPEYTQELPSVLGGTYAPDEVRGGVGEQLKVNGVDTAAMVPTSPVLQDWLDAIQALPLHGTDYVASIDNGAIYIEALTATALVIADGTVAGGIAATGLVAGTYPVLGGDLETGRADQVNEQRILTTLGVLVAHLRLLSDRDEARNLHFVLSRIATGVGSGGFVYRDASSEVTGNVRNPAYIAGDLMSITVTNPATDTAVYTLADIAVAGPFDVDAMVTAIQALTAGAGDPELDAVNAGGYLQLVSANGNNIEIVTGTNDRATNRSGLEFGLVAQSDRARVADKVKEDALDYFDTNARDLNL